MFFLCLPVLLAYANPAYSVTTARFWDISSRLLADLSRQNQTRLDIVTQIRQDITIHTRQVKANKIRRNRIHKTRQIKPSKIR